MDQGVIEITWKLYRKSLLWRILLSHDNEKKYLVDLLGAVHLIDNTWKKILPSSITNCFVHARFSCATSSSEPKTQKFCDCDELCDEMRKLIGCADRGADGDLDSEEYALYENDVPVTGNMIDAKIIQITQGTSQEQNDEEPQEIPTEFPEAPCRLCNMLYLLRNKVEHNGGEERLMRCLK